MRGLDVQHVLRWIVTAMVMMVAIVLLGAVLKIAGFLLPYAIKGLLLLLLVAVVLRFVGVLQQRR